MKIRELFEGTKTFGSVAPLAMAVYSKLSPAAKNAVDNWNVNWDTGSLEQAYQSNTEVAKEITTAFEPVRNKLRSIYGDTIPLYRGEKNVSGPESSNNRVLFSWTLDKELATKYATNSTRGIPKEITDTEVNAAIQRYNKTGFTTFGNYKYIKNKEAPEYFNIYMTGIINRLQMDPI